LSLSEISELNEDARNSLDVFAAGAFSVVNPGVAYKYNWHIDCICEHLQAFHRKEIRRLIVNIPPRELKSFMFSILFPAWVLGKQPHEQFIVASHTMRPLAAKLSNDTRRLMESAFYKSVFLETGIDKNTESLIVTTKNGHRLAAAVHTGITGLGFNYGIIDDPNKPDEALSDGVRTKTNDWIDNTFMSRANDRTTACVALVMQRVHDNDATGHLLEKGGYYHLKLPSEAKIKTYSYAVNGRKFELKQGALLHPARLPSDVLKEIENDLGSYNYAGQYLQEPAPIGGGMFKRQWIQWHDPAKFNFQKATGWILCDPAGVGDVPGAKKRKKSDWTAFMVVALGADNNYYLMDIVRDKFNPTERVDALMELHRLWSSRFLRPVKVGYEEYGIQTDLHYIRKKQDDESYRFPLISLGGSMSKPDRIARLIPDMEGGRWYFPHKIMYTDSRGLVFDLVKETIDGEMMTFPVAKHDDCIDALSRIYDEELEARFPKLTRREIGSTDELVNEMRGQEHWLSL
jgi:predicted phage terminase large subunit-like protein